MTNVNEFIDKHNEKYKSYCEIIILKDGTPVYAIPSHQMKLMVLYGVPEYQVMLHEGKDYDDLMDKVPISASPTHYLADYLNAAVVWYENIILPYNYTEEQIETIKALIKGSCLDRNINIDITKEYHLFQIPDDQDTIGNEINKLNEEAIKRLDKAEIMIYNSLKSIDLAMAHVITRILDNYKYSSKVFTTYGELANIIKCSPREVDKFLEYYDDKCKENGLPPISTLVINAETNMPGDGYFRYHFAHDTRKKEEIWVEQFTKINYDKYLELFRKELYATA